LCAESLLKANVQQYWSQVDAWHYLTHRIAKGVYLVQHKAFKQLSSLASYVTLRETTLTEATKAISLALSIACSTGSVALISSALSCIFLAMQYHPQVLTQTLDPA